MKPNKTLLRLSLAVMIMVCAWPAFARNAIRRDFFDTYPQTEATQLDDLPSNSNHCGVCHFDFNGGGPRNAYGLAIEVRMSGGMDPLDAILEIVNLDVDNDGFSNLVEITDPGNFNNTPTFPGLAASNVNGVANVDPGEVSPYITPTGATDITAPQVTVLAPTGGEVLEPNTTTTVSWVATDASGIAYVNIYLSDDGGDHYRQMARHIPDTGEYSLFIPNLPGLLRPAILKSRMMPLRYSNAKLKQRLGWLSELSFEQAVAADYLMPLQP